MRPRRARAFGLAVVSALVLAVAVYTAWWKVVADGLRDGIDRWRIERQTDGLGVEWASTTVAGFPDDIVITIAEPVVGIPGTGSWRGERLEVSISPLALDVIRFRSDGVHVIEDLRAGRSGTWTISADAMQGTARGNLETGVLSLDIGDASVSVDGGTVGVVHSLEMTLERHPRPPKPDPAALVPPIAYSLVADLEYEDRANAVDWPSGDTVQYVAVNAVIRGDLALPPTRGRLAPWRDEGGVLEFDSLSARSGPLRLTGNGTFSVDGALQPVGALSLSLEGYDAVVDWLVARGRVGSGDGDTIKALLGLLARGNGAGGSDALSAAVTLQDGKVFLGPFELGDIPPVNWPD